MIHCKPDQLEGITMIPARRCGPACVTPADKPELMRCSWPANTFQRYRNGLAQPSTPQLRKFLQAFNFIQKLWQNSFPENTRNCKKKAKPRHQSLVASNFRHLRFGSCGLSSCRRKSFKLPTTSSEDSARGSRLRIQSAACPNT